MINPICDVANETRYALLNSTRVKENLAEIIIYANCVTNHWFALFLVISFFLAVFIGSLLMQFRFGGKFIRVETSFLASSFATLGFAIILETYSGILNPSYFVIILGMIILGIIANITSDDAF